MFQENHQPVVDLPMKKMVIFHQPLTGSSFRMMGLHAVPTKAHPGLHEAHWLSPWGACVLVVKRADMLDLFWFKDTTVVHMRCRYEMWFIDIRWFLDVVIIMIYKQHGFHVCCLV